MLTDYIRDKARLSVVEALDSRPGKKALVLDPDVYTLLGYAADPAILREHGVDSIHLLSHTPPRIETPPSIVYMLRPSVEATAVVCDQIRAMRRSQASGGSSAPPPAPAHATVCFVPRRTLACTRVLEDAGLARDVAVRALEVDLVVIEKDLVSLELGSPLRETLLEGSTGPVYYVARAIHALEQRFGEAPLVQGVGPLAYRAFQVLMQVKAEAGGVGAGGASGSASGVGNGAARPAVPPFSRMILVDREVDYLSLLCTQLTYEGLIDEVLGIKGSAAAIPTREENGAAAGAAGPSTSEPPRPARVALTSADRLYAALRDLPFPAVGRELRARALEIQEGYRGLQPDSTVGGMRDFVKKLGALPELDRHTDLAQTLSAALKDPALALRLCVEQELISAGAEGSGGVKALQALEELLTDSRVPAAAGLRLICLASHALGAGLARRQLEPLLKELGATHGPSAVAHALALQRSGLLRRSDVALSSGPGGAGGAAPGGGAGAAPQRPPLTPPLSTTRRALDLLPEDTGAPQRDASLPPEAGDVSFAYGGLAPGSVRLVQLALQTSSGLTDAAEKLKVVPAPSPRYYTPSGAVVPHQHAAPSAAGPAAAAADSAAVSAAARVGIPARCVQHAALAPPPAPGSCLSPELPMVRWFELRKGRDSDGKLRLFPPLPSDAAGKGRGWRAAEYLGRYLGRTWLNRFGGDGGQAGLSEMDLWGEDAGGDVEPEGEEEGGGGGAGRPVALVVFIGGVTFAELAALRSLAKASTHDLLILTTGLVSGNSVIADMSTLPLEASLAGGRDGAAASSVWPQGGKR